MFGSIFEIAALVLTWVFKQLGYSESQAKAFLQRISLAQNGNVGPSTQDELAGAQKDIDDKLKQEEKTK